MSLGITNILLKTITRNAIGRFYARDIKVIYTYLTSDTLKTGVKTGRGKVDDNTKKNRLFCKKTKIHDSDSSQSSLDELGINESQFTVSCFYTTRT